jgi:hypothetical protein
MKGQYGMTTETGRVEVQLDEGQIAAAAMVAEKMNAMSPEERNKPETMQQMAKEAEELINEIRKRRLALGIPARGEVRSWDAPQANGKPTGGLNFDWRKAVPPTIEELNRKRYLIAVNRVASGKVDDPQYSLMELADIADVMNAGSLVSCSMEDFIKSRGK